LIQNGVISLPGYNSGRRCRCVEDRDEFVILPLFQDLDDTTNFVMSTSVFLQYGFFFEPKCFLEMFKVRGLLRKSIGFVVNSGKTDTFFHKVIGLASYFLSLKTASTSNLSKSPRHPINVVLAG